MNTEFILLEENDILTAQNICNSIENTSIRNKSVANVLGALLAGRFFNDNYDVDIDSGLHNSSIVLNDIDISDIYINGHFVDVRLFFNKNEICIPKAHFDNEILPDLYMFIEISSDLSKATLAGFIRPKDVDKNVVVDDCYFLSTDKLSSLYDIEDEFSKQIIFEVVDDTEIYSFIDGTLQDKFDFYKRILTSRKDRLKLLKALKTQAFFDSVYTPLQETQEYSDDENLADDVLYTEDLTEESMEDLLDSIDDDNNGFQEPQTESLQSNQYSTVVSPSLDEVMEDTTQDETIETEYEQLLPEETENEEIQEAPINEIKDSQEQEINSLFDNEQENKNVVSTKKKKSNSAFIIILLLIILAGGGVYYYVNYMLNSTEEILPDRPIEQVQPQIKDTKTEQKPLAMPNETVEKPKTINNKEEGNSVTIPAIEQNLNASVIVSNLKVDWEVPAGYVSNTAAKRYLIKMGKIIQLNLKTELMLQNKLPITNKISVEIKYNKNTQKFETVDLLNSSGEKVIDDIILRTINNALKMNISGNTDSFNKMQENPILIIHL